MKDEEVMWVKCNNCGNETSADLDDCTCERCEEFDWSPPYGEDDD